MDKTVSKSIKGVNEVFPDEISFTISKKVNHSYICTNFITGMDTANKKSKGLYWVLFLLSVAAFFIVYASSAGNFITLTLPFIGYFFVKALDVI